jgi:hypothetical protein
MDKQAPGIRNQKFAKRSNARRIAMRHNLPNGHARYELRQQLKFRRALPAIQDPIHIGILHEFEKDSLSVHFLDAGSIRGQLSRREKINSSERLLVHLESGQAAVQWQVTLFPG